MADIEKWITINGAHIPIIKGESRARAVSNFIKGKQKARKSEIRNKLKGMFKDPNGKSELQKEVLKNSTNAIAKNERPTIKGRAKTLEELRNDFRRKDDEIDKYMDNYYKQKDFTSKEKNTERANKLKEYEKTRKDYLKAKKDSEKEYKLKAEKPTIKGFKTKKELDRRYNEAYNKGEDLRDSYSERLQPLKDMPNKWDKEADRIHRQYKQAFMSKYKLKASEETPAKKTIKGVGKTAGMKAADKKYIDNYNKAVKEYNKETKPYLNPNYGTEEEVNRAYNKASATLQNKTKQALAQRKRAYTYKRKK